MDSNQIKGYLLKALRSEGDAKPRSQQVQIGPSELGSCRRKVWLKLQGQSVTNTDTKMLASWMGTTLHDGIEKAVKRLDLWEEDQLREVEVERDGIKGHVDLYHKGWNAVVDWKTTTKKNLSYFPSKQQRWQVQVYGWLMAGNGHTPQHVALVAIPRDGNEDDVVVHVEPYDEDVALEAIGWLEGVKVASEAPAPEKHVSFCASYCEFYGACEGMPGKALEGPLLADDEVGLARDFLAAKAAEKAASDRVDALKEALAGVAGRSVDGISVSWSERTASTVDRDAVKAALGEVPMKAGKASLVLSVKEAS